MEIKNQNVDNVVPKSKWEFDADVAHCFANMLERSIPDYRSMRSLVYELGERFIKPQTVITDIGCSTGLENVLSPLKAEWNEDMLHEAGFEKVDMFWRCLNFCGWVAIK